METIERLLQNEKNPEVLRGMALFAIEQSKIMAEEIARHKSEIAKKEKENQLWLNAAIKTHLHKLQRLVFDNGRESLGIRPRTRRTGEEQLLLHAQSLAGEAGHIEKSKVATEEESHFAEAEDLLALARVKDPAITLETADIAPIEGMFEKSTEITITERTYKKVIHKRQKYRVKNKTTGKETLVTAAGPLKLAPGCRYSVDLALSVVAQKFMNHMPYERQQRDMKRLGVNVPVMTMFRLSEQVSLHLESVAEEIRADIFRAPLACHLDETPWPILSNHDDDGQMWVLSNQAGSYYRFEPSRSGKIADELLRGYFGPILTDKYPGYVHFRNEKSLSWGLCWSHARREFLCLEKAYPEEVAKIVILIDDLFAIERKGRTWESLKGLRETESKNKLEEIKAALMTARADFFDQDDFCKAIHYVLSGWTEFTKFIDDVRMPLSNNDAERALRHAVLGRKNFNGSRTINGADVAATLYTVIESCKKVDLDPIDYMKYVITENQNDRKALTPIKYAQKMRGISESAVMLAGVLPKGFLS